MIFTVHLNRLIDENTPLEQSTIETCLQEAYKYQKVTKISCDIWSRFEASWLAASRWWARWRSQSSSCQHHVITWRGLIPADHEYLDSVAWPCHDCEVAPVWYHDVTNPRTCQFSAVCLTVFPFEFRPRTFTIGFYGKNSIISELMILECSFPLNGRHLTVWLWARLLHFLFCASDLAVEVLITWPRASPVSSCAPTRRPCSPFLPSWHIWAQNHKNISSEFFPEDEHRSFILMVALNLHIKLRNENKFFFSAANKRGLCGNVQLSRKDRHF